MTHFPPFPQTKKNKTKKVNPKRISLSRIHIYQLTLIYLGILIQANMKVVECEAWAGCECKAPIGHLVYL